MKKVLILFIIVNVALFAENQEVARIVWELRDFPEKNYMEFYFNTNIPKELRYAEAARGQDFLENYRHSFEGSTEVVFKGTTTDWHIEYIYDSTRTWTMGSYPETFLWAQLGEISGVNMRTIPFVLSVFLENMQDNTTDNLYIERAWSLNDQEYTWRGSPNVKGYRSFTMTYVVYKK